LLQLGLVVPGIDMAGSAVHEEPDDRFRFGGEVRLLRRQRVGCRIAREQLLLIKQAGEGKEPESTAGALEEVAPRQAAGGGVGNERGQVHGKPRHPGFVSSATSSASRTWSIATNSGLAGQSGSSATQRARFSGAVSWFW